MTKSRLLILIIALALLGIAFLYLASGKRLVSENAEVSLAMETVSAQVTGYVTEVNAQNGQGVAAGDVLARLDPTDYGVALSDARAVLDAMKKGMPQAVAQSLYAARAGQPDPAELEERLAVARRDELAVRAQVEDLSTQAAGAALARRREESLGGRNIAALKDQEAIISARLDAARDKLAVASQFRAQVELDLEQQKRILQQLDNQTVISQIMPAQIEAQVARVRQAELNLANTEILAPVDGHVIMRVVEPGQVVSPGQPLLAVVPEVKDHFYVTAAFPAEQDGKPLREIIKQGQYCEISLPDMEGLELAGRVEEVVLPGGAPFALPGEAPAAEAALPQISVRVAAQGYDPQTMPPLQPGMKAVVSIDPERMAEPPAAPTANKTAP